MNPAPDLILITARSVLVAAAATALGGALARLIPRRAGALVLLPWVVPAALAAYAWSNFVPGLQAPGARVEAVYALLLVARLAPLAALVTGLCGDAADAEARHGQRLLRPARGRLAAMRAECAAWWAGPGLGARAAFALTALLALDEFEIASFLPVRSWTVPLLDAQAGGLPLAETLRRALPGMLVKAPLWLLLGATLARRGLGTGRPAPPGPAGKIALPWTALALGLVLAGPLLRVGGGAFSALGPALAERALWGESLRGWLLAAPAAALALLLAGRRGAGPLALLVLLPGPLPLGLLLLRAFQLPGLRGLYDTPAALVLGWTALLLPSAVLLQAIRRRMENPEAVHAAALLPPARSGRMLLRLRAPWLAASGLALTALAAPELTVSSLLACPGWTTAATRIHNFMHYGHSAKLSALILLHLLPSVLAMLPLLRLLGGKRSG